MATKEESMSDIPEMRSAYLKADSPFLQLISAYSRESMIVTDLQGFIIYCNEGSQTMFGYKAEDMLGKTPAFLYPELDERQLEQDLQQILNGKDYVGEWQGRRKDGTPIWVDIRTSLLRDANDAIIGFIGVASDITARIEAETQLKENHDQLQMALETANMGTWTLHLASGTLDCSAQCKANYGLPANASFSYEELLKTILPEDQAQMQHAMQQALQEQRVYHSTYRIRWPDGSVHWIQATGRGVYTADGTPTQMMGMTLDVTERKTLEQRKDAFIGTASHELRTPLTSIKGFVQLLQRHLQRRHDEQGLAQVTRIEHQVNRLIDLVADLLEVSRIQTGKLTFRETEFDLDELIQEVVENVQVTTTTHHLIYQEMGPASISGDRERIRQVLVNLLSNAIKYSPSNTSILLSLSQDIPTQSVTVSVRDYGVGIAREEQASIFERFYQADQSYEPSSSGLGLGLYLCQVIITHHRGRIWVESEIGKGSTFTFTLPIAQRETGTNEQD
jgi:PAS domain S-box-containing protein